MRWRRRRFKRMRKRARTRVQLRLRPSEEIKTVEQYDINTSMLGAS